MLELYVVFDRVASVYGEPFVAAKRELAIRKFDYVMSASPMVATDCDLFFVGFYDNVKGIIIPSENGPEFIRRFASKEV